MADVKIYSHNEASEGARSLAEALGVRRLRHTRSTYVARANKVIINWGSSQMPPDLQVSRVLNRPDIVRIQANKLGFFRHMDDFEDVRTPNWTTDRAVAQEWSNQGRIVCARTILTGHSGAGLVVVPANGQVPDAPLYTLYVKKQSEFRVHFAMGQQIDVQRKIKRTDFEGEVNWQVRNHQNGFIYARNEIVVPGDVTVQAARAFNNSGLDFGAVDVIYNAASAQAYVLEINTAPGLAGTTVDNYANAFRPLLEE